MFNQKIEDDKPKKRIPPKKLAMDMSKFDKLLKNPSGPGKRDRSFTVPNTVTELSHH